ncbi:MAG: hypothetical protein D6698_16265 [Gammaproteobacteria bacterium]|nr:MAG: hypothetical protein D6698_16265 [Gammaproteobacteria bacterium]
MAVIVKGDFDTQRVFYLGNMTTAQRTGTTPSRAGAMVFDTDLTSVFLYDGTNWVDLSMNQPLLVSADAYNSLTLDPLLYMTLANQYSLLTGNATTSFMGVPTSPHVYYYSGSTQGTLVITSDARDSTMHGNYFFVAVEPGSGGSVVLSADPSLTGGIAASFTSINDGELAIVFLESSGVKAYAFKLRANPVRSKVIRYLTTSQVVAAGSPVNVTSTYATSPYYTDLNNPQIVGAYTFNFTRPGMYRLTAFRGIPNASVPASQTTMRFQWYHYDTATYIGSMGISEGYTGTTYGRSIPAIAYLKVSTSESVGLYNVGTNSASIGSSSEVIGGSYILIEELP